MHRAKRVRRLGLQPRRRLLLRCSSNSIYTLAQAIRIADSSPALDLRSVKKKRKEKKAKKEQTNFIHI